MNRFIRNTLAAAVLSGVIAAPNAFAVDKLTTEKEKISYMVGMDVGSRLRSIQSDIDLAIVMQALNTVYKGEPPLLPPEEASKVAESFQKKKTAEMESKMKEMGSKNKTEGATFLAANKVKPGVKTTASGLQYQVVKEGTGPKPKATDKVKVHYTGTLTGGQKFDSSVDRGAPAEFVLNQVIPGWTEGVQLMSVGSKYKFVIPSALAYGERAGPIPPNSTLVFDVELLEIMKAEAAAAAPK